MVRHGEVRRVAVRQARLVEAEPGMVVQGGVWLGTVRFGRYGALRRVEVRRVTAVLGLAR